MRCVAGGPAFEYRVIEPLCYSKSSIARYAQPTNRIIGDLCVLISFANQPKNRSTATMARLLNILWSRLWWWRRAFFNKVKSAGLLKPGRGLPVMTSRMTNPSHRVSEKCSYWNTSIVLNIRNNWKHGNKIYKFILPPYFFQWATYYFLVKRYIITHASHHFEGLHKILRGWIKATRKSVL